MNTQKYRIVVYEVWYEFISPEHQLYYKKQESGGEKQSSEDFNFLILERGIRLETNASNIEATYTPRSAFHTIPNVNIEPLLYAPNETPLVPSHADINIGLVVDKSGNVIPQKRCIKMGNERASFTEAETNAIYYEHLHILSKESVFPKNGAVSNSGPSSAPFILYTRRIFNNGHEPDFFFLQVNLESKAAYYLVPPAPFIERAKKECLQEKTKQGRSPSSKSHLPFFEEQAYALVFNKNKNDPFVPHCEESARVAQYFTKFPHPLGGWRFMLAVPNPKPNLAYGIHFPLPLAVFESALI